MLGSLLPLLAPAQVPPGFDMAVRVLAPVVVPSSRPYSHHVVVDAAGNSYVTGRFGGSARFDNRTIAAGASDGFIAKIDANGNHRWIIGLKTGGSNNPVQLAFDGSGNLYAAGTFAAASLTLGSTTLTNAGGSDLFVGRLDTNGNWLSARRTGGTGDETLHHFALDGSDNAYLTGSFTGSAIFGSTTLASSGVGDLFIAKLQADGTWAWAVRGGSSGLDWGAALGLDASGHVYVAGQMMGPTGQLGPFALPGSSMYLARVDANTGTIQRVQVLNAANSGWYLASLAVDAAGNCYLAGSYLGRVSFGSIVLNSVGVGISNQDVFVAKLDAAGNWQWASTAGGTSGEYCTDIALDARGSVYVSGVFRGPFTRFGTTTLVPRNPSIAFNDAFVAKLDATGRWQWAVPAGGPTDDLSTGMALGPAATPYLVGEYFSSSMTFGSITIPGEPVHAASTYVARLHPNILTITGDSLLCNGGTAQLTASTFAPTSPFSYRWNTGATTPTIQVTQPGTYTVTATFAGGYSISEQFKIRGIMPSLQISGSGGYLCPGTPRQLTAVAPGATAVRWNTGAITPSITVTQLGLYSVTATYSSACMASTQVTIAGSELRISGRQQLCPGQSTLLTAAATGSAVTAYLWNTGATTPTLRVGQAGTFRVTASLADGCQVTATHTVGPPRATVASISGDTLLCPGTILTLTALNPDAISYQWTTGATTPTIQVAQPGRYGALLTYAGGCTSYDSLLVLPAPLAPAFTLGPDTTLCLEQPLLLRAPDFSGPGVSWRWSDGSTNSTLLVQEPGTYSLQIITPCDSRTSSRRVDYKSCLFIPNIITPNNDYVNDRFVIQGLTRGDWSLTLYNRWGRQIYYASAYRHDWGADATPGGYYYLLRHATTNVTYKGWLDVIR